MALSPLSLMLPFVCKIIVTVCSKMDSVHTKCCTVLEFIACMCLILNIITTYECKPYDLRGTSVVVCSDLSVKEPGTQYC